MRRRRRLARVSVVGLGRGSLLLFLISFWKKVGAQRAATAFSSPLPPPAAEQLLNCCLKFQLCFSAGALSRGVRVKWMSRCVGLCRALWRRLLSLPYSFSSALGTGCIGSRSSRSISKLVHLRKKVSEQLGIGITPHLQRIGDNACFLLLPYMDKHPKQVGRPNENIYGRKWKGAISCRYTWLDEDVKVICRMDLGQITSTYFV